MVFPEFPTESRTQERSERLRKSAAAIGALIAAIAVPSLLSGCEFGNRRSTELSGYDTLSGYYVTLPQSVSFRVKVGTSAERNKNGLVSEIPDFLKIVMGNPTALVYDDPLGGIGSIRSRENTGIGFFTRIDPHAQTYGASEEMYAVVDGCRFSKTVTTSGKFSQLLAQQRVSEVWARGKISLDYRVVFETQGEDQDCAPLRAKFQSCFIDGTGCSADSQSVYYEGLIQEMFNPVVNTGLMTANEIPTTSRVEYRAIYD